MKPGLGKATPLWKPLELQISEIHRIVSLIQKVNCSTFALISETASELGIKKTTLMQYIEDHPKNFSIQEITSTSTKGVKKILGLGIKKVYLTPEDNPVTEEWLAVKKKEWEKKIYVFEQSYYGQHEFWFLAVDDENKRSDELSEYEKYVKTKKFVEEIAKNKFGLIYPDELIFKPNNK